MKKYRNLRFFGIWFAITVVFYCLAVAIFPVDSQNTLVLPSWYLIIMVVFPIVVTLILALRNPLSGTLRGKIKKTLYDHDKLYNSAVNAVLDSENASASMIQRRLKIDFHTANSLLNEMERNGIVSGSDGVNPRSILTPDRGGDFYSQEKESGDTPNFDSMEGHEFEYFCADILRKNGFTNVEVTRGSGDQGVDVLAEKDGITYAIQCKCYSSDLGNTPIQEVNAGKIIYHRHIGVVMTNRHFTPGAKEAAAATGVLLWDREKLLSMIETAKET